MAAMQNDPYKLGVPAEILNDANDYMDVDYAYSLGADCFSLAPKDQPALKECNCHLDNMGSIYAEDKYNEKRDPPIVVGKLQQPQQFDKLDFSAVDVLIKTAGEDTYNVPVELSCLQESIQMAIDFFHANHPAAARDFYCYVRPSSTVIPPSGCQRYKWIHADGLLGMKHKNSDGTYNKKLSYNFTVFNELSTEFFIQPLDVSSLDVCTHDYTKFFEQNVDKSKAITPQKSYEMACFDGYTLHRSPINRTDQVVHRKFVTVNFAPYLYDGWGTMNLHYRELYKTPVYYNREMLAWLPGGDWGQQHTETVQQKEKKQNDIEAEEAEFQRLLQHALTNGCKPWNRGKIMIVGEGRAGKTALANSMVGKDFVDTASTIGINQLVCDVYYTRENAGNWTEGAKVEKELETGLADMIMDAKAKHNSSGTELSDQEPDADKRAGKVARKVAAAGGRTLQKGDVNQELVMKCYADNMKVASSDLRLSIFDYGGQSIFNIVHHLFLTQFGVYVIVFNMEWYSPDDLTIVEGSLSYLRFWLNSVVIHTINNETGLTAPIFLVGTRKDTVSSVKDHVKISNLLTEKFKRHKAWASVIFPDFSSSGGAPLCFFPVDNTRGRSDPEMLSLSSSIENTVKSMDCTQQNVPLSWLRTIDQLHQSQVGSITYTSFVETATSAQTDEAEIGAMLHFFKEMGILLWIDERCLREVVIMDAISYLVSPATLIICQHTPDLGAGTTVHHEEVHRDCARRQPLEWEMLMKTAILNESLLPGLWREYLSHKEALLMLMTKYGMIVPFYQSEEESTTGVARTYLVPSLLPLYSISRDSYSKWSDESYHSCMFVFSVVSEFESYTRISRADLVVHGFLPSGLFERVIGKAVSWCQTTSKTGMFNIRNAVLFRNMAVLYFGNQKFRLTLCQDLNCIRLDIDGEAPLVVHDRIYDQILQIISECMHSLRCFTALVCNATAKTTSSTDMDTYALAPGTEQADDLILVPLRLLNHSAINDSALVTTVSTMVRKLLSAQDVIKLYDPWLKMQFTQRDNYDVFISYRWNDDDQALVSGMFDTFTNYAFPGESARAIHVFLDTKRLIQGRRFDLDFSKAICNSKMVVPILSYNALELMGNHNPDKVDNMLLEWILAMECFSETTQTVLKGIFPLTIGKRTDKSTADSSVTADRFQIARALELLPKIVPTRTLKEAELHLKKHNIFSDSEAEQKKFHARTVHEIVDSVMHFLFFDISHLSPNFVVAESVRKTVDTLETLCRQDSTSLVSPTQSAVANIPAESARADNFEKQEINADKVCADVWKILSHQVCYTNSDNGTVEERLHSFGLYDTSFLGALNESAIQEVVADLKTVPQKKAKGHLMTLHGLDTEKKSDESECLDLAWAFLHEDRYFCLNSDKTMEDILDELGIIDSSFLSDLDPEVSETLLSNLKVAPRCRVQNLLSRCST